MIVYRTLVVRRTSRILSALARVGRHDHGAGSARVTQTGRFAGNNECACFVGDRCLPKFGGLAGNELTRFVARAAEQYYLGCESFVNDIYHNLVLERFCKKRKSSRIEGGLAH
jgi:hypothetical protein